MKQSLRGAVPLFAAVFLFFIIGTSLIRPKLNTLLTSKRGVKSNAGNICAN